MEKLYIWCGKGWL